MDYKIISDRDLEVIAKNSPTQYVELLNSNTLSPATLTYAATIGGN